MPVRTRSLVAVAAAALLLAGCGDKDKPASSEKKPATPDQGFAAELARQSKVGLEIAELAVAQVKDERVKRFAQTVVAQREHEALRLRDLQRRVGEAEGGPEPLKVPREADTSAISRKAVAAAAPLKNAFLVAIVRLDRAAVLLAQAEQKQGKSTTAKGVAAQTAVERGQEQVAAEQLIRRQQ
jgi:predicted outer membrane protein